MPKIVWEPEAARPKEWVAAEEAIREVAAAAEVKLTLRNGEWFVRALLPPAMCHRGRDFSARDVSAAVAEALADNDIPARVFSRPSPAGR